MGTFLEISYIKDIIEGIIAVLNMDEKINKKEIISISIIWIRWSINLLTIENLKIL